jgi:hypothetical protein
MTLEEVKAKARENPLAKVTVFRKLENPKNGKVVWNTREFLAKIVYKNLSLPFERRSSGWKRVYLEKAGEFIQGNFEPRFDKNSLSDPALIQALKDAGFEKVAEPVKSLEAVVSPQMSDAEMLEYLKNKGAIHGKVKLKNDEPEPETLETDLTLNPE